MSEIMVHRDGRAARLVIRKRPGQMVGALLSVEEIDALIRRLAEVRVAIEPPPGARR